MIFLTDKSMRLNMKKFGYKSYDSGVLSLVNQYLENYTKNTLTKAAKQNKNALTLEASHVIQAGGRIVLPSEYFGVASGSYFGDLKNNGTNMAVTETMIRPVVATYDLSGAIKGGASDKVFKMSKKALQNAISEAKVSLQSDIKVRSDASLAMHHTFQKVMSDILTKTCGKCNNHLTVDILKQVAGQRKYKALLS